ncbi:MAG: hypothetical protein FJ387_16955 [Verrucomicrobia bacterium]|nr:hypothetical protein [Verrucomicrobiota bacterium]
MQTHTQFKEPRRAIPWAAAGGLVLLASAALFVQAAADRPNILWITCEDTSPHLGCYGDPYATTPSLDRFAQQAILYRNAFAYTGVCAPSRSCLITGVNPPRLGSHHMRSTTRLPESVRCFTERLRAAGYFCSNNAKEDYNFATPKGAWDQSHGQAHWRQRRPGQPFFSVFNLGVTHQSQIFATPARTRQNTARLTPAQRHDPAQLPLPPIHPDTPEVRRDWARHYDNLTALDYQVGDLLAELDADGLAEETMVFFFGDNGTGMPAVKMFAYEMSNRVPLLIRLPQKWRSRAQLPAGAVTDRLVCFLDFAPTVLSLCDLDIPPQMQGVPFLGARAGPARDYLFGGKDRQAERYDLVRYARDPRFLYLRNFLPHLPRGQYISYTEQMESMKSWRAWHEAGQLSGPPARYFDPKPAEELYDIQTDPWCLDNLAGDPRHTADLARLRDACLTWMRASGDLGLLPERELHERARASTPYDIALDPKLNPLDDLLRAANLANARDSAHLPELRALLEHQDAALRWWGALGLVALGANATPAQAALLHVATHDSSPDVRVAAAEALAKLGQVDPALAILASALRDQSPFIQLAALNSLDRLGPAAQPALPTLRDPQPRGRGHVEGYVGRLAEYLPRRLLRRLSGIYPHLAYFSDESECGTGAVVPWADRLWMLTYSPHKPAGSSDKLYEITPDLEQIVRPESIGGTPANRMIHRESQQLFIGPYAIDAQRRVRAIPYDQMFGRPTGNARHLTAPAEKIYYASMEEGFYEVDVHTLAVTELWTDEAEPAGRYAGLPGYHGKGLYSGQGRLVYANNGEHGKQAQVRPDLPSGCLAEWDGQADHWTVVRRNQFTEVTGPGGLYGNANPASDPIWSIGWDHRSLILMCRDTGRWHAWRLPKASHCYDGAHGWNTEWPRIRDIGEDDLLMTMHGSFWRFPNSFSAVRSAGLAPRSTYLKVVGDFCRWGDQVVFGCDDTAKSEFLNQRKAKGTLAGPGKSQSNLWFVEPARLDHFGPALGRGAVWLHDPIVADVPSEAFLFTGYTHRSLHVTHDADTPLTLDLEVDLRGDGNWRPLRQFAVPARGYAWTEFGPAETGAWVRLRPDRGGVRATAFFHYRNADTRAASAAKVFAGLAQPNDRRLSGGLLHARGAEFRTLRFIASNQAGELGCYDLDGALTLRPVQDPQGLAWTRGHAAIPDDVLILEAASVLHVDDAGNRWRLPKGDPALDAHGPLGAERVCREVCTERDLFNAHGTFYELPAENAGGFAKVRPIATHNRRIKDYASYRGLLVLSGVAADAPAGNPHIIRSDDGQCALWVGAVDDLWQLGKPRGRGGPWHDAVVQAGVPSDPYLMSGYDTKHLRLAHHAPAPVRFRVDVDLSGTGQWVTYRHFEVPAGRGLEHRFPDAFGAYWVRLIAGQDTTATAVFTYE